MRLNLRLQRAPLADALLLGHTRRLVHERLRGGDHVVEAVGELAKLVARRHAAAHAQIALLHLMHGMLQCVDGLRDGV